MLTAYVFRKKPVATDAFWFQTQNNLTMKRLSTSAPASWVVRLVRIGHEQQPLLIIDDFAENPDELVQEASHHRYGVVNEYYPGIRADAPDHYIERNLPILAPLLEEHFGYPKTPRVTGCFYSLVTTRPEQLKPAQCIPHFDGGGDRTLALLHYLCQPSQGGTAFFRHRSTGMETVPDDQYEGRYKPALWRDAERLGMPPHDYPRGSTALFERIGQVDAAFNRAIVYRGANLHAIDIPHDFAFDAVPETGRLTINTFLSPS